MRATSKMTTIALAVALWGGFGQGPLQAAEGPDAPRATSPDAAEAAPPPPTPPSAPTVEHAPVSSCPADTDWTIHARIRQSHRLTKVTFHFRQPGQPWRHLDFQRAADDDYTVTVPAAELPPGIFEYWIGSLSAESPAAPERPHFASAAAPHPVVSLGDREARWRQALLSQQLGNRSRFTLTGEYVDFGQRTLTESKRAIRDYFVRGEVDYTYRILHWVYSIRLGVGLLRGDTYEIVGREQKDGVTIDRLGPTAVGVGLTYGFAELRFRFGRLVRFDLKATFGASGQGFDGGAGGQLLIGYDPGTNLAVGIDGVSHVGVRAWLRLTWNTVPRVPLSLTLESTNLPLNGEFGSRVYLTAHYRFHRFFSMHALAGYGSRDFGVGGPTAGLGANLEF